MAIIYLVTTNYDWEEACEAFHTRATALTRVAELFEVATVEDYESEEEFWQAVADAYEAGKWKGFQFLSLDTTTLKITDVGGM